MSADVIVIGAGLSGLTAASLLAKSGLKVIVVDQAYCPGGTCGSFVRRDTVYDQATAMLFGFGTSGFNPHKLVFDILEEPIDLIRHQTMYAMEFMGKRILFHTDMDRFLDQITSVFPEDEAAIRRFYHDLSVLYEDVIAANPPFTTPDESDFSQYAEGVKKAPRSYLKFMSFMFRSTGSLLKKYFTNPELIMFFDKLCSTYCYTPAEDTPAVLGAVMFIENHQGGSFYPAGGAMFLPGKLEKVIEANGGQMLMRSEVQRILFDGDQAVGIELTNGSRQYASNIIYSGNVWDFYERLTVDRASKRKQRWAESLVATHPSSVVYLKVRAAVIPEQTIATEMLAEKPANLNEDELTFYISTLDDHTLCESGYHTITAIGPSFENWDDLSREDYVAKKKAVRDRVVAALNRRFPGLEDGIVYATVATPRTLMRYSAKYRGSAAGPMQKMGQHMLKRQHIRTEWANVFCCGESTVMGTGTPAVTISGVAAANAVLKRSGLQPYTAENAKENHVHILEAPYTDQEQYRFYSDQEKALFKAAKQCNFCENPACTMRRSEADIPGIMRRITVENIDGAHKRAEETGAYDADWADLERHCIRNAWDQAVPIGTILEQLRQLSHNDM